MKFAYSEAGWAPVATPTDILTLKGPINGILRLRRFRLAAMATTAGFMPVTLLKRTAANTGGTSTAPAIAERNEGTADPASVVTRYTANPGALGAAGDIQFAQRVFFNLIAQPHDVVNLEWDADDGPSLQGTEWLALNLGGGAVPSGGAVDILLEWEER